MALTYTHDTVLLISGSPMISLISFCVRAPLEWRIFPLSIILVFFYEIELIPMKFLYDYREISVFQIMSYVS